MAARPDAAGSESPVAMLAGQEESGYPSLARAYLTLALLVAAYICSYLDRQILSLMVTPIRASLGVSDFQISLLQGFAFGTLFAFAGLPIGWLADRVRRTQIIVGGLILWTVMTIACGLAASFGQLFLARMGLGIGEAALVPAGFSLLADSFDRRRLVRATAIFSSGGMFGGALAYFVGGLLLDFLNGFAPSERLFGMEPWQAAFILVSLPGFVLVPLFLILPEPSRKDMHVEVKGIGETFLYLWGRRRDYAPFYLTTTLLGVANYSGTSWFPTHLIRYFGMKAVQVGIWLGTIQLVATLVGTLLGAMLTEHHTKMGRHDAHLRTIVVVSALGFIGIMAPLMPSREPALVLWFVAIVGLSGYFGSNVAACQLITPNAMRGSNSALMMMSLILGGLAGGTALVGALSDNVFPNLPAGIGYSVTIVGGAAAFLSIIVAWRGRAHFAAVIEADMLATSRRQGT